MENGYIQDIIATSVEQILQQQVGSTEELSEETDLLNELALDSLELVEVGLKIEKRFGKKLPISDLRACVTVGELVALTRQVNSVEKV